MKESDQINDYLELDDQILNDIINDDNDDNDDNEIEELESAIYILYYPHGGDVLASYGMKLNKSKDRKYLYIHSCCTKAGSSGSPILDLNNKVIGIQISKCIHRNVQRYGNFLNYPIKEFIQQNIIVNKKEIVKKENVQEMYLSFQDRLMEKFNFVRKHLGKDIFEKLDELFRSYKISFNIYRFPGDIDYSLNLTTCKNLINQAENFVYKIKVGNKEAIGFFCKIPITKKDNMLSILITNNNILNDEILNKEDEKIIIINN